MRSFDYARTPPEAPEGLPVFVVRLVAVSMIGTYGGGEGRRQRLLVRKIGPSEVEQDIVLTR